MGYAKKLLLWLLVLGVAFEFNILIISSAFAQTPPRPGGGSELCNNATTYNPPYKLEFRGEGSCKAINNQGDYECTITYKYYGNDKNYVQTNINANPSNFYMGNIVITNTQTNTKVLTQSGTLDLNSTIGAKVRVSNKKATSYFYAINQKICYRSVLKHYYLDITGVAPVEIKIPAPGSDPTVGGGQPTDGSGTTPDPNGPARTSGDIFDYQQCVRVEGKHCDDCCNSKKGWGVGGYRLPTIAFVECWITCSVDDALTKYFDFFFGGLEYIFEHALGLQ